MIFALVAVEAIVLGASWLQARRTTRAAQSLRAEWRPAQRLRAIPVENAATNTERSLLYAGPR